MGTGRRAIKARFWGFCLACGKEHIKPGDPIVRDKREDREGWSVMECWLKKVEQDQALAVLWKRHAEKRAESGEDGK